MKYLYLVILTLAIGVPGSAKTHRDDFEVSCDILWPALKDTLRNSGKYGIIAIDNAEKTASYNMGGNLTGKRINSAVLNPKGSGCEMQVQTAFSGLVNNDAGDLRKRVEESLVKLRSSPAAEPAPATSATSATAARLAGNPLTNADVLSLKQAGISDQLIIEKIQSSPAKYRLETNDLLDLKKAGVSDAVVSSMIEASRRP